MKVESRYTGGAAAGSSAPLLAIAAQPKGAVCMASIPIAWIPPVAQQQPHEIFARSRLEWPRGAATGGVGVAWPGLASPRGARGRRVPSPYSRLQHTRHMMAH